MGPGVIIINPPGVCKRFELADVNNGRLKSSAYLPAEINGPVAPNPYVSNVCKFESRIRLGFLSHGTSQRSKNPP
jgi:hypothetical protein